MFILNCITTAKGVRLSSNSPKLLYSTFFAMSKRNKGASGGSDRKRQKKNKPSAISEGSHEEVLLADIRRLLSLYKTRDTSSVTTVPSLEQAETHESSRKFTEIDVQISELSSTGDGLGLSPSSKHVYVVPFTSPGDLVRAKIIHKDDQECYTLTDFIQVIRPSPKRDDSRIKCPYFAKCSGCQFQMLSYEDQLAHKKTIIERAYLNFSGLAPELVPPVSETIGSPLQYGYRTKLTPHFDGPRGGRKALRRGEAPKWNEIPPIGFMQKGTRWTIDIEDCPIGTNAVRVGMKTERERVTRDISQYKRGATLLLRESTERKSVEDLNGQEEEKESFTTEHLQEPENSEKVVATKIHKVLPSLSPKVVDVKTCITNSKATATEYVDYFIFTNNAGAFFQNNNSILSSFTQYIRDQIKSYSTEKPPLTNLIDAYCGSGLFTITLSSLFSSSIGIDISDQSIESANKNAELNSIQNTRFLTATASALFASVESHPDQTVVVIDPPRKGCDQDFLKQLLGYGPQMIVYVSCNVHTQARDVGILVEGTEDGMRYDIESLRGFDFFPQTGHVEGVAVLRRSQKSTLES